MTAAECTRCRLGIQIVPVGDGERFMPVERVGRAVARGDCSFRTPAEVETIHSATDSPANTVGPGEARAVGADAARREAAGRWCAAPCRPEGSCADCHSRYC